MEERARMNEITVEIPAEHLPVIREEARAMERVATEEFAGVARQRIEGEGSEEMYAWYRDRLDSQQELARKLERESRITHDPAVLESVLINPLYDEVGDVLTLCESPASIPLSKVREGLRRVERLAELTAQVQSELPANRRGHLPWEKADEDAPLKPPELDALRAIHRVVKREVTILPNGRLRRILERVSELCEAP
jgi:hypothetical protein